jgi:hypothetical protein
LVLELGIIFSVLIDYKLFLFFTTLIIIIWMETQLEKAGKKIGNYLIGKSLGQGTFGKVKVGVQI